MHKTASLAYTAVSKSTLPGRELEASLLTKAAVRLRQAAPDLGKLAPSKPLEEAIRYNLRIWDVLHADWESPACALPPELRTNVLTLSVYVHKASLELLGYGAPAKLETLIKINESLAQGLSAKPAVPSPEMAAAV